MIEIQYNDVDIICYAEETPGLRKELHEIGRHPVFVGSPVRFMKDAHPNDNGMTIGFTMPMPRDPLDVPPGSVGVDIGCGVLGARLDDDISVTQETVNAIVDSVPLGLGQGHDTGSDMPGEFIKQANRALQSLSELIGHPVRTEGLDEYGRYPSDYLDRLCDKISGDRSEYQSACARAHNQLGTVGSGNHFIEIAEHEHDQSRWIIVHSGSRGIGYEAAMYWIRTATRRTEQRAHKQYKKRVQEIKANHDEDTEGEIIGKKIEAARDEPDGSRKKKYDTVRGDAAEEYLVDLNFLQHYARANRMMMARRIADVLDTTIVDSVDAVHNYIDYEDGIIRKGATPARAGERILVPVNASYGSVLLEGNDPAEYEANFNNSIGHGAGRAMATSEAKKLIGREDLESALDGIHTVDLDSYSTGEAPQAYRDFEYIQDGFEPSATKQARLKPLANLKG